MRIFGKAVIKFEANIRLELKVRFPCILRLIGLFNRSDH